MNVARRQLVVVAAGVALAGVLFSAAACGDETTTIQEPDPAERGITVAGQGSVTAEPDTAMLTLGVSTQASTVAEARDRAATALDAMIASIRANGVDEKDIQTQNLSIYPEFDYDDGTTTLRGYRVTNQVSVKVREIDNTSKVVDDAVAAGGDDTQIQGITFTIDDPAVLKDQAREAAVRDARARADTLARAAGVGIGDPLQITESDIISGPIPIGARAEGAAADVATPIEPGELEVIVNVTVTWAID
jgi:uncharacterized protein YggE